MFDALQRHVTVTGTLRSCCAEKVRRVLDFAMIVAPGHISIDLAAVNLLEPSVVAAIHSARDRLATDSLRLTVVGTSPAAAAALDV